MLNIFKLALIAGLIYGGATSGIDLIPSAKAETQTPVDCAQVDQSQPMSKKAMLACL